MMAQPPTICFHIGAHKTATTHLQVSLETAADSFAAHGVRYLGPERFRLPGQSLQALFGLELGKPRAAPKRDAVAQLAALAKGADRLVISEENFIGPLNFPKGGGMRLRYKTAADRIAALTAALGQEVSLFLAIRQPTTFLNSAYCQALLGGQAIPVVPYLKRNPLSSVDWLALARGLAETHGVKDITVWRYEDYRALFPHIVTALIGNEAAPAVTPHDRQINKGLSMQAVAEVLHRANDAEIDVPASVARHLLSTDMGFAPFDAFAPDDHAASAAEYAVQWAAMADIPKVTRLSP